MNLEKKIELDKLSLYFSIIKIQNDSNDKISIFLLPVGLFYSVITLWYKSLSCIIRDLKLAIKITCVTNSLNLNQ